MTGPELDTDAPSAGLAALDRVIAQPITFKARLGIREDAFTSLRAGRGLAQLWHTATGAALGGTAAASSAVATTFFATAPTTLWGSALAALGLGTAAATPLGWVAAAAAAGGAFNWGAHRLWRSYGRSRVDAVPRFINTPVDVLGASLFNLMGGLAVLVAQQSGALDEDERAVICDYFIEVWGYDAAYLASVLPLLEADVGASCVEAVARDLAQFVRDNPDCDHRALGAAITTFLEEVSEADGQIDAAERHAMTRITAAFDDVNKGVLARSLAQTSQAVGTLIERTGSGISDSVAEAGAQVSSAGQRCGRWPGGTHKARVRKSAAATGKARRRHGAGCSGILRRRGKRGSKAHV